MEAEVDVFLDQDEASKAERPSEGWSAAGSGDMQAFAKSFARWAPNTSRKFSGLDIEPLLQEIDNGKPEKYFRVIGFKEFPYRQTWVEREYWLEWAADISKTRVAHLAGHDGLVVLHVHYAGKWNELGEKQDRDIISQINIRHTVQHEDADPGVNAYWKKCEDLDKWRELHGEPIFTIPPTGWRWRQQRTIPGPRWDNGFAPVIHDLLMLAEKCTCKVRAFSSVQVEVSPGARKALVVGVEKYDRPDVCNLPNAVYDAVCLKSRLEQLGWSVEIVYNPGLDAFDEAIDTFMSVVKQSQDACLFAFVGHGVQVLGEHFLVPADIKLKEGYLTEDLLLRDMQKKAVAFSDIEANLKAVRKEPTDQQVSLFVLDCCRNSISTLVGEKTRALSSPQRGQEEASPTSTTVVNSFIVYSTTKGSTAKDGRAGKGGPFMGIFTKEMMSPVSIQEVMVRTRTKLLTDDCQLAPEQSTLTTTFSFRPIAASPAAAATSQGSGMDADLVELLTKWGLKREADIIAKLGVHEVAHLDYLEEADIDEENLPKTTARRFKKMLRVVKESIAKKLFDADLSGHSTDEAGSESESESASASPGFAAGGHVMAAYSRDNLEQFSASANKFVDEFHATAKEWLGSESGGKENRHPFCATVLLNVLRDTRFKQNKDIDLANEWYWKCVQGNMRLCGDILEGFQSVIERGSLPTELLQAQTSSSNAKQHRRCVALIDAAVQLLHQQSSWGDVAEWNRGVVDGWFTTSEGAVSFLDKAEAYLRRNAEPEKLDLKVLEGAVEIGSFVAFFLADRFTQMLLFAVVEYRRASSMARRKGMDKEMDADTRSTEDGTLGGFCFLASSTGRACDLRGEGARCQLRGSPAVVAMLQFMASLPIPQSMLGGGEAGEGAAFPAHADKADLDQGSASEALTVSRIGVLADEAPSEAVTVGGDAAASCEAEPVSAKASEDKGKDAKGTDSWDSYGADPSYDFETQKGEKAKDLLAECGGMPVEDFAGEVVNRAFLCGICLGVMVKPHSCREGHSFCFRCISQSLKRRQTCPNCRGPLLESDLVNNRPLQDIIENLPMRCPTAVKIKVGAAASGCTWTGVLAERERHLKECAKDKALAMLHKAVSSGDLEEARALLAAGANIEGRDKDGNTPLHLAAENGHAEAARALMEAGADKEAKDKNGWTPLHLAALEGHAEAAKALMEAGADMEAKNGFLVTTPLHLAAAEGHAEAARALMEAGADMEAKMVDGLTPLHLAADRGHAEAASVLMEAGADMEAKMADGRTPLHCAAWHGHAEAARALMEAGADKEAKMVLGDTPLHLAANFGQAEAAKALVEAGANKEAKNKEGRTPRDIALQKGHGDLAKALN